MRAFPVPIPRIEGFIRNSFVQGFGSCAVLVVASSAFVSPTGLLRVIATLKLRSVQYTEVGENQRATQMR